MSKTELAFYATITVVYLAATFACVWAAMNPESIHKIDGWLRSHPKLFAFLKRIEKRVPKWIVEH